MNKHHNYEIQSEALQSREVPVCETNSFDGNLKQVLETGRNRLLVTGVMFMIAFVVVASRMARPQRCASQLCLCLALV